MSNDEEFLDLETMSFLNLQRVCDMFSRILNLQIYQKKIMKYSLFCISMR